MGTSALVIVLVGNFIFGPAISANIDYEPIQITVNENFNSQPGYGFRGLQSYDPAFVHQGANFYFKPQLNIRPNFIPSHIDALISLLKNKPCSKDDSRPTIDKDKLLEILKPFINVPSQNNIPGLEVIPDAPSSLPPLAPADIPSAIGDEEGKLEQLILEEPTVVFPEIPEILSKPEITVINTEPKPVPAKFSDIPEAPVLPPLAIDKIPLNIVEEVKLEDKLISEENKEGFPTISVLPPLSEPIAIDTEPKPVTPEFPIIPEAPVLPPLDLDDIPSALGEEIKLEEQLFSQRSTDVFPENPEILAKPEITVMNTEPLDIPEAPVLPPLALEKIPFVSTEEQLISEDPTGVYPLISVRPSQQEPIAIQNKPIAPEFAIIPEAPVLPSLIINNIPSTNGEAIKLEEQIISQEPTGVFPEIPEILAKPEITFINTEPKPIIAEFSHIPEAPVLPPLVPNNIPATIEEEIKLEEQLISEVFTDEHSTIPEVSVVPEPITIDSEPKPVTPEFPIIPEVPVLPPLDLADIPSAFGEEIKLEEQLFSQRPTYVFPEIPEILANPGITVMNTEPKPVTAELSDIPEAPVLPPQILDKIPFVSTEEQLISEEPTEMYPTISLRPSQPEPIAIETKPIAPDFNRIPEAPVLPPLIINNIPSANGEAIKLEEQIISQEPTVVFPEIPEILAKPEITFINTEPIPITAEFSHIPEAPVLPPLVLDKIPFTNGEEVKFEEQIISREPTGVYPIIPEILIKPKIMVIDTKNKPINQEFPIIPEAPVLPPLVLNNIPATIGEEIKLEEQLISGEPTGIYPSIPEILAIPEVTVINTENKPISPELPIIPEAPVLPPLAPADIPSAFEEEIKTEEQLISQKPTGLFPNIPEILYKPTAIEEIKEEQLISEEPTGVFPEIPEIHAKPEITVINTEPKPIIVEFSHIPEAPVLPPLGLDKLPFTNGEEVKLEEQLMSGEPTAVYPMIPEMLAKPEIAVIDTENKPINQEIPIIPEAPVLPPLVLNNIPATIGEEIKLEEQLISGEPTGVYTSIPEILAKPEVTVINTENKPISPELPIIPEAPVLPPLAPADIPSAFEEEIKSEEQLISQKPTGLFPDIPEILSNPTAIEEIKEEQLISEEPTGVFPEIPEILAKPEITVINTEPKPIIAEFSHNPEAPVLPPLVLDKVPFTNGEEVKLEEQLISEMLTKPEITAIDTEIIPVNQEFPIIPEAPVLPPLVLNNIPATIGEEIKLEEQLIPEVLTDELPTIPGVSVVPEPITIESESKPIISKLPIISEAPLLPSLPQKEEYTEMSSNPEVVVNHEELVESPDAIMSPEPSALLWSNERPNFNTVELEETIKFEKSIQEISKTPAAANNKVNFFGLGTNPAPEGTERVKLEPAPLVLEELKKVYSIKTPQFSDSFVLKEFSRPSLYNMGRDIIVKKTPTSEIILPGSRQGLFSFAPFISPFSQRVLKKKVIIPKSASLEHFLLKKHPFSLPIVPSPKLTLKANSFPKFEKKNRFLYSTSCAQNIVKERIAPNMFFNKLRKYFNFK